jgi:hypothetical protein
MHSCSQYMHDDSFHLPNTATKCQHSTNVDPAVKNAGADAGARPVDADDVHVLCCCRSKLGFPSFSNGQRKREVIR